MMPQRAICESVWCMLACISKQCVLGQVAQLNSSCPPVPL